MKAQNLKGQHNQCPGCEKLFKSNAAFDKHRTGSFGVDRRCMTSVEMEDKGMVVNLKGFWITSLYEGVRFYDAYNDLEDVEKENMKLTTNTE